MNHMKQYIPFSMIMLLLSTGLLSGCCPEKKATGDESVETVLPSQENEVTAMTFKKTTFSHELVTIYHSHYISYFI